MATTKQPVTTVSYNTELFLKSTLDDLTKQEILDFWVFIKHKAEGTDKKTHYHLYLEPTDRVDKNTLRKYFNEWDSTHPTEPLGVLPLQITSNKNFFNWYFYVLHNNLYLASKGKTKKYHYEQKDFVTSDILYFNEKIDSMEAKENVYVEMKIWQQKGYEFEQYIILKNVNPYMIKSYFTAWEIVSNLKNKTSASPEDEALEPKLIENIK